MPAGITKRTHHRRSEDGRESQHSAKDGLGSTLRSPEPRLGGFDWDDDGHGCKTRRRQPVSETRLAHPTGEESDPSPGSRHYKRVAFF